MSGAEVIMAQTLPTDVTSETTREKRRQYYWQNRDRIRAWRRERYKIVRPHILEQKHRYYLAHKTEISARHRLYKLEHPEQTRILAVKWKAKVKLDFEGNWRSG